MNVRYLLQQAHFFWRDESGGMRGILIVLTIFFVLIAFTIVMRHQIADYLYSSYIQPGSVLLKPIDPTI